MKFVLRTCIAIAGLALAVTASAQITAPLPLNSPGAAGPNALFPKQNVSGPTGVASQVNYPYPGQCLADPANKTYFPLLPACQITAPLAAGYAPSFACTTPGNFSGRSAGGWAPCGAIDKFKELAPNAPPIAVTSMFQYDLLNPPAYTPDTTKYANADYYEIAVHEAWGFDQIKGVAFPNPGITVPNGKQWTGLRCSPVLPATTCTGGVAAGAPLLTPIWGVGQVNKGGGPVTGLIATGKCSITTAQVCSTVDPTVPACPLGETCVAAFNPGPASAWSQNNFVATWPSISLWTTKNRPVVVKWVNEFPNQHVFCPHPEAADFPCAIDRTFMGVKAKIDPALAVPGVPADGVNQYGSPQQPDNSWVTHYHGEDTPPATDGFAEKWFGSPVTAPLYSNTFLSPPFDSPLPTVLRRPTGNFDTYTYPAMQDEMTVWFHDHTLGKTHHNVIAGPAGFAPVTDEVRHLPGGDLAWLNRMYPGAQLPAADKDGLGAPKYDLYLAIQDRSFNDDGSINFSNGLGQPVPAAPPPPLGASSVTPGVNPQVHPVWVPEYFGDHALVNGVLWPRKVVDKGWYRLRIVNGSDSRCWTIGFSTIVPALGTKPGTSWSNNVPFYMLANDQGYLRSPVLAPGNQFTMCPGERYELLINFGAAPVVAGGTVTMTNSAPAPFPAGITPYANKSPYAALTNVMQFQVTGGTGITSFTPASYPAGFVNAQFNDTGLRPMPLPGTPGLIVRQIYMNERADGVTLAPMGMQLNGVPFEYKVTETPKKGTTEYWQFVNLTVDAHPMHPHLVKHLIVQRQPFNVGQYKNVLCGSNTCQPGTAPGMEMQVVPDVTPMFGGAAPVLVTAASIEGGWKDASQVPPGMVTTIVARWEAGFASRVSTTPVDYGIGTAPKGDQSNCAAPAVCDGATWTYDDVTTGPYVWHCHINSHEDSEMMHTSLVVP